jgi:type VI secretion system protein ImpL
LHQQASIAPAPLKQWIFSLTNDAWKILLMQTRHYVEQRWQRHVFPFYQNKLVGYYPFSKEAMNEVSLQSFNQFFASSGLFDRFFTNYLLPFIDQSSQTWQWRERDGLSLTFAEAALGQIQRAYQIHHAFFPGNSSSANVKFTLKPASFSVGVKRFGVDMDEQYLSYVPQDRVAKTLYWPGNAPVHGVTLMVEDDAGHVAKQTEVGLWAWFKLFNSADQYEASTEHVKATFRLGSYLASCEFDSDQNNNPLNPLLLQQLDLPENL